MSWLRLMEERMKMDEPVSEAKVEAVHLHTTRRTNKVISLIKDMWPAYVIELFVIILGISITLALEEWRDGSKEKRLEFIYLKNLLADVELDLQSLNYTVVSTRTLLAQGNDILGYIRDPTTKSLSHIQFTVDIRDILARPDFIPNDATFSDLKASGNLHLLEDIQLKNWLFAYYSQTQYIKDVQAAEQQATIILSGSYFLKQFPMGDFGDQQPTPKSSVMHDLPTGIEFANNIILRITTRNELLSLYQKADSLARQLKQALLLKTNKN